MAKAPTIPSLQAALTRERRKNRRLRALIDELREGIRANNHELSVQLTRLGHLQAEVDLLKAHRRE
jgi:hypothetical protein